MTRRDIQFTGKERDAETGLDNFLARYMSSPQGRFQSPDPDNAGADPTDPQSWNAYTYGLNRPLTEVDPTGLQAGSIYQVGNCYFRDTGHGEGEKYYTTTELVGCSVDIGQQLSNMANQLFEWASRPRNPWCMSKMMAAGSMAGAGTGALAGGGVLSLPGAVFGFGFGGLGAGIIGLHTCAENSGPTSSGEPSGGRTGGRASNLREVYERIERLDLHLSEEELVEKIKAIFPKHWNFDELPTNQGILLRGARDEGILVTEEGVFAGRVTGVTIPDAIQLLRR